MAYPEQQILESQKLTYNCYPWLIDTQKTDYEGFVVREGLCLERETWRDWEEFYLQSEQLK